MFGTCMAGRLKLIFSDFFRSLHQLWLEVSGALFVVLAAAFGFQAVQEYRAYMTTAGNSLWLFFAATVLALLTLGFGVHSFWKARKLR